MFDKLTARVRKKIFSRVVSPVIIKTKYERLMDILESIRPYTLFKVNLTSIFPRLSMPEFALTPVPVKIIDRFNMISAILPREIIFDLAEEHNVEKIFADEPMWALYQVVPDEGVYDFEYRNRKVQFTTTIWTKRLLGADKAHIKGYLGGDVLVSVTDTGASRSHEQTSRAEFKTTMPGFRDENGHGTWCVACVGGRKGYDEYLSFKTGKRIECEGMAPSCDLLAVKCLGYFIGMGMTSDIIEAIDISVDRGADIISMSLGGESKEKAVEDDPYFSVFEEVIKEDIIPVVAAGNEGPESNTVGSPGCLPNVLTVGAIDPITGDVAEFSSRGPTNWGTVKPDIVSYGVNVDSATDGVCDTAGDGTPSRYSPLSGTSMATPHVAGLLALMREALMKILGKKLSLDEVKTMVSQLGEEKNNNTGWGLLTWDKFETWMATQYGVSI